MAVESRSFNNFRNVEKAINSLKGILAGLTADRQLNEQEILFLDVWLKSQDRLKRDGDVVDLLDLIGDILHDGVVEQDEIDDLKQLCADILSYKEILNHDTDAAINEFLGVLQGITADDIVNVKEFNFVKEWINSQSNLTTVWPIDAVSKHILQITEDNEVTEEELLEFTETLKLITGSRFNETGSADGSVTEFLQDDIRELNYGGSFCFTGTFVSGPRRIIEKLAFERGAMLKKGVSHQLDYLVIGSVATKDWMFSSHGRKIEAAVKLRDEGHPLKIVTEQRWLELVL